jgi:hypothetical protein
VKPPKLYTSPDFPDTRTVAQIAADAGCSTVNVYVRLKAGLPIRGHVWTPVDPPAPRTSHRVLKPMVSDALPGRTYSQVEVRALGNLRANVPIQPYVRKGWPIGGHVWRYADTAVTRSPGQDNVDPPARTCAWRKGGGDGATPAPEGRTAWVYATDPAAYEVQAVNPMRLAAAPDGQGVTA